MHERWSNLGVFARSWKPFDDDDAERDVQHWVACDIRYLHSIPLDRLGLPGKFCILPHVLI